MIAGTMALAACCQVSRALRCPAAKFITHTLSHFSFLLLLAAATFRLDDRSHVITSTPRLFNDSYSDDVAGQSVGGALCDRTLTVALLTSTATNHGTSTARSTHVMRLQRRRPGSAARGRGQRAEGHVPTGQHSLHPRPDLPHVLGIRYVAACSGVAGNFFPRGAKFGDLGDRSPQVGSMGNLVIITYKIFNHQITVPLCKLLNNTVGLKACLLSH